MNEGLLKMSEVYVWTDGACKGNPGPGGWGAVIKLPNQHKEICGGELVTTNNRMELMAVIACLQELQLNAEIQKFKVIIHTDSQYVQKGMLEWIKGWKARGWKTAAKEPVKNQDLWQQLDHLAAHFDISWRWVRGHDGDPGNERADYLANQGILTHSGVALCGK